MAKNYHYTDEEIKFIENNYLSHSDKEISQILGRTIESVGRQRKKYGWIKRSGRPSREEKKKALGEGVSKAGGNASLSAMKRMSLAGLDKDQRLEIFKENFTKQPRYYMVQQELSEDELGVYEHKYIEFMMSVDTMSVQEEDSLHHMIMTDLNISRIRRHIRSAELENEEGGNPLIYGLYDTLEKAEKRFVEYQKILSVTREKRLSKDKEQKETIHTVVQSYRNKMARQEMGRQAGLMEIFREKCNEDMSSNRYLLG